MLLKEAANQPFIDILQAGLLFSNPVSEMCDVIEIAVDCSGGITAFGKILKVGIRTGAERRTGEQVCGLLDMG